MEAAQESPCSYLHLKLAKTPCFSFYLLCFSSTKLKNKRAEQILWWGRCQGKGWEDEYGANNAYRFM
jgi:hypothetical protein